MAMNRDGKKPYLVKRSAPRPAPAAAYGRIGPPAQPASPPSRPTPQSNATTFRAAPKSERLVRLNNEPFLIQIGLDFGTCFAKCVCRDLITERAWIHIPADQSHQPLPFLIPCSLIVRDGAFARNPDPGVHYPDPGLFHLKQAIAAVGREDLDAPALAPYGRYVRTSDGARVADYVLAAGTYLLAHILGDVRRAARLRLDGFGDHPADRMFVNMAVPVADMSQPSVEATFLDVLRRAWELSENAEALEFASPERQIEILRTPATRRASGDMCYLYPEVSASVQGYVRSRSAREATYLCADVGAGTVDVSLFIFHRQDDVGCLTYLDARVLPLGSSQIEVLAARGGGAMNVAALESLRHEKEHGGRKGAIETARTEIWQLLSEQVKQAFMAGVRKGQMPAELIRAGALCIGGGKAQYPYIDAIESGYQRQFRSDARELRPIGIALPRDLEHLDGHSDWMTRLYVAYGLSFFRDNLTRQMYPHELADVPFEQRRIRYGVEKEAITKDLC